RRPPTSPLVPYTTLFRSVAVAVLVEAVLGLGLQRARFPDRLDAVVELVGAAAGDGVDDAAGGAAELDRVAAGLDLELFVEAEGQDRKSTRLNSSHVKISY